jgi:hypothetical protein
VPPNSLNSIGMTMPKLLLSSCLMLYYY